MKRVVLITGCSSGIGAAAALAFARAGNTVVATMRNVADDGALRGAAAAEDLDLAIRALDVADAESIAEAVSDTQQAHGRIDILVNNAGVLPVGAFETIPEEAFRHAMEVNFFGPAALTRAVLPSMRARRDGLIIYMSSLSGIAATAGDSVYAASKFALEGLVEGLCNEVARFNVRVALVEPGRCDTRLFNSMPAGEGAPEYRPLNAWLQEQASAPAPGALAPGDVANLLVEIAAGREEGRLRWPAGVTAQRVFATLFAQQDKERHAYLRNVAGVEWWVRGERPPE